MSYDLTKPLFILSSSASLIITGSCFALSNIAIPTVLRDAPDASSLLLMWRNIYERGKSFARPIAATSAVASLASAYTHYHPQAPQRTWYFVASAFLTLGIVPFTATVMGSNVGTLLAMSDGAAARRVEDVKKEEVEVLVKRWGVLNIYRGLLPLVGALAAFQAL